MHDGNPHALAAQHDASLYREVREFERFTLIRVDHTTINRGLMKDVGVPKDIRYVIWGKIRPIKRFEFDRIVGTFDDGSMVLEFNMPLKSKVPQVKDFVELHGVQSRQRRMRYLIKEILPDLSVMIGACLISPIGNEGAGVGS